MAINLAYATGSISVSTTELGFINGTSTIATSTDAGIYQAFIEIASIAYGDIFDVYLNEKTRSGDTQIKWMVGRLTVDNAAGWPSASFILGNGWDFSMKKISGTDRTVRYSVRRVS